MDEYNLTKQEFEMITEVLLQLQNQVSSLENENKKIKRILFLNDITINN